MLFVPVSDWYVKLEFAWFFSVSPYLSLIFVGKHCVSSALNMWTLTGILLCEEYMWEQKVNGVKQLGQSGCGESNNILT